MTNTLYAPTLSGCRHLWLSDKDKEQTIRNLEEEKGFPWAELQQQGWKIERYDEGEYL